MPASMVRKMAKDSGKSIDTVEKYWDEAKKTAEKEKPTNKWAYVVSIVKRRLGLEKASVLEMVTASVENRLNVAAENANVFGGDKYTWYKYYHATKCVIPRRGSDLILMSGDTFGLRPATSKKGTYRLISKETGPSIIYSIDEELGKKLLQRSTVLKKQPK